MPLKATPRKSSPLHVNNKPPWRQYTHTHTHTHIRIHIYIQMKNRKNPLQSDATEVRSSFCGQ